MTNGRKPAMPRAAKPLNLEGIALHDAKLFSLIFLGASFVHVLFRVFYIPIVDPPLSFSSIVDVILFGVTLVLLLSAVFDLLISIFFHFRNRLRKMT
jgi:hypothetical protein